LIEFEPVHTAESISERDEVLRSAHRRAFSQIIEARATEHHEAAVRRAVEELIDACEAYTVTE
jgi:hypothetical protein